MRITVELIQRSHQAINALGEREICLRGQKIVAIENLGATLVYSIQDQFEVIDLTNNEIIRLEDSAPLRALTTLLLSNNEISKIAPTFGKNFPRLENLILTNNKVLHKQIKNFTQIDNFLNCKQLKRLSLLNNQITSLPNYRLYVIFKIPSLAVLDFQKVKLKVIEIQERVEANTLFHEEQDAEDTVEKKRKLEEGKSVRVPIELPKYLQTHEESLNFTT